MVSADDLKIIMELEGAQFAKMSEADQAKCMELLPQTQTAEYKGKGKEFFAAADANGDGRLDRGECDAFFDALKKQWEEIGGPNGEDTKEHRDAWYAVVNKIDSTDGITWDQFEAVGKQQEEAFAAMSGQ